MASISRRRFLVVPLLLSLWILLIFARLVFLQVFQFNSLTRQARRQQERTVEVSPVRGVIYDRNHSPLAISVEVDSVFAVPGEISNPRQTAKLLAPLLPMRAGDIQKRLQSSHSFSWVQRKIAAREAARIRQLNLPGIYFQKETKRFYPKRELAAHVLGHVGVDDQGLAGVEVQYDELLRGRSGQLLIERDARQRGFRRAGRPPEPGENLVLTLDENIQHIAEQELAAAIAKTRALAGTVIIQDPLTGEILALANQPTFNPNRYADANAEVLRNRAISSAYEPGSTFKIITVAAALEEKLASPDDRIDCQMGSIVLAGHTIRDHKPFGLLSVQEIFQYSSDVGAIKLALRMGNEGLYRNLRTFGFGSPTGIELPGEARGLTKPPERWSKISIGAIAMGQEIGVTPLQMVTAASAVANGGWWVRPRIVRQGEEGTLTGAVTTPNPSRESLPRLSRAMPRAESRGQSREAKSKGEEADRRRILSPETAAELQQMMGLVVLAGTGKMAQPEGYTAAGKTGTAQKTDPETGRYSMVNFVASFVGFAPADSPQLTILVVLDSPRGQYHGGDVAAPVFKRIAEQVLAYRNLPAMLPRFDFAHRPKPAERAKPSVVMASRKEPTPPLSEELPDSYPTRLLSLDADAVVPNFLGKTVRAVTEESLAGNLAVRLIGSGIAYSQNPLPGTPLPEGHKVRIWFRVGEVEGPKLPLPTQPSLNHPEAGSLPSNSANSSRPASG